MEDVEYGKDMKVFVRCPSCRHVVFTDHVLPLMTLVLGKERYTCKECGEVLDFIPTYVCARTLSDKCDSCEFRFTCYSVKNATQKA